MGTVGGFFQSLAKTVAMVSAAVAAIGVAAAAVAVDLAKDSAKTLNLQGGYIRSFGKDMEGNLAKLREASKGTISDQDLMAASNKAALLGITKDTDKLSQLMITAKLRGQEMGLSTTQAFDDLVTGIGRGSPLILDNLGIKIPESFTKMTEKMNEADKKQALLNLVMADGQQLLKEYGGKLDGASDPFERFSAKVSNLKDQLGQKLLPVVSKVIDVVGNLITTLPDLTKGFQELITTDDSQNFAIALENLGLMPDAVKSITDAVGKAGGVMRDISAGFERFKAILESIISSPPVQQFIAMLREMAGNILTNLKTAWDTLVKVFEEKLLPALQKLQTALQPIVEKLMPVLAVVFGVVVLVVTKAFEVLTGLLGPAIDMIISAITFLIEVLASVITAFNNWVAQVANGIAMIITWWNDFKTSVEKTFNAVGNIISNIMNWISKLIQDRINLISYGWNQVKTAVETVFNAVRNAIEGAFNSAVATVKGVINNIIRLVNNAIGGINNMIKAVNGASGMNIGLVGNLPMLAKGVRNFVGGMAMVGERGPELVNLPKGSDVITNSGTNNAVRNSSGGGDVYNVTVDNSNAIISSQSAARSAGESIGDGIISALTMKKRAYGG